MPTKNISAAASRRALFGRQVRSANIGAANPFALFIAKNHNTVAKLPFDKRAATLAVAYREQSPAAFAVLKAEAQKNAALRQSCRREVKAATTRATAFGLFANQHEGIYKDIGFKGAAKAIANKYKVLSASDKSELTEKAARKNAAAARYKTENARKPLLPDPFTLFELGGQ